jgi:hypothetical protein
VDIEERAVWEKLEGGDEKVNYREWLTEVKHSLFLTE